MALLKAMRPRHWIKNSVLLAGILFTLDQGHPAAAWLRVGAASTAFCLLASAIYLINDLCDVEQDRKHPRKRHRPLAAGHLSTRAALGAAVLLVLAGLGIAFVLGGLFAATALAYVGLTVAYSFWLKHLVLIDVMALAGCYVIRAAAGAAVISVNISPWLLACTTLGALLLGLAKRRNELVLLDDAGGHRRILDEYSLQLLDQLIGIVTATTLMTYMLYTFFSPTGQQHPLMLGTTPFVIYGLFRFLYLMHRRGKGGNPAVELVEDSSLLACGFLWGVTCVLVILLGH